jgi:hypothetical protein
MVGANHISTIYAKLSALCVNAISESEKTLEETNGYPRRWLVVTATINVLCSSYGCETATTYLPTGIISGRLAELVSKRMRAFSSSQGECKTIKFAHGTIAKISLATGQSITLTAPTTFGASWVRFSV